MALKYSEIESSFCVSIFECRLRVRKIEHYHSQNKMILYFTHHKPGSSNYSGWFLKAVFQNYLAYGQQGACEKEADQMFSKWTCSGLFKGT